MMARFNRQAYGGLYASQTRNGLSRIGPAFGDGVAVSNIVELQRLRDERNALETRLFQA